MHHQNPNYMAEKNLWEIGLYAQKILDLLERGAGRLPEWVEHKISTVATHMKDVGHYLRYTHETGRRYGGVMDPCYMCRSNLRQIIAYAEVSLDAIEEGVRLPQWIAHKLSISAEYMDCVGHFIENEAEEGRRYGRRGISRGGHRGPAEECAHITDPTKWEECIGGKGGGYAPSTHSSKSRRRRGSSRRRRARRARGRARR